MINLKKTDPEIFELIKAEEKRTASALEIIPSNNYPSKAVLEALGSILNYKYSEGYPKKRYYQGQKVADDIEMLVIERVKKLFGVPHANVQPYSGSPANTAVQFALLEPLKDKILALSLANGGHLTHGSPVSFSGKYFKIISYPVGKDGRLDYDETERLAIKEKPKLIICGGTAIPRIIDFKRFGEIADRVGAYLLADISHIAGLIVGGAHPSPVPYVHIIMTTTHKTLRGPRGAMIMVTEKGLKKDPELGAKIDKAVFPGLQGGPHDNQTAAIGVALLEASKPAFKTYAKQIVKNAKVLALELVKFNFNLVSGGTDNHLILIDLRNKKVNGRVAAIALEKAGIILNFNGVPFDNMPPLYPSGVRLGTPALTTRRMREKEMVKIAKWINEAIEEVKGYEIPKDDKAKRIMLMKKYREDIEKNKRLLAIAKEIQKLCKIFPIY